MKGLHHIILETSGLKYEFDIKRIITVIAGDSATGKTTMIDLLYEYTKKGAKRGVSLSSDVPCTVYSGSDTDWKYELEGKAGHIVFFDEDYKFIFSKEFADYVNGADNYFVFITRKPVKELPYSISEIYGIRTSGKFHFPDQVYHEFYPLYDTVDCSRADSRIMLLVEDEKAGYEFYKSLIGKERCFSANGNANVYLKLLEAQTNSQILVIADGAAFGAYIENVLKYAELQGNIALYFPESFEWMILKSGILEDASINDILKNPEDYIDSTEYLSWERFFSALLIEKTKDDSYKRYSKAVLSDFYMEGRNQKRIANVMPKEIRELL